MSVFHAMKGQFHLCRIDADLKDERPEAIRIDAASQEPKVLDQIGDGHDVQKNVRAMLDYFTISLMAL
jgi:hypothetical protein